jgi:hypothetical protein
VKNSPSDRLLRGRSQIFHVSHNPPPISRRDFAERWRDLIALSTSPQRSSQQQGFIFIFREGKSDCVDCGCGILLCCFVALTASLSVKTARDSHAFPQAFS